MIKSPVFLQFVSSNCKLEFKSAEAVFILGFNASSALIDQKSTALINSLLIVSMSHLEPPSRLKLIKLLFLKLLTAKPLLKRFKPLASFTSSDLVSNSRALNEVISSKFSILFSNAPISLIVKRRLSNILIEGPFTGSYK